MNSEEQFQRIVELGSAQRPRIHVHRRPMTSYLGGPQGQAGLDQNGNGQVEVWLEPTDPNLPVIAAHEFGHARREIAGLLTPIYLEARRVLRHKTPGQVAAALDLPAREGVLDEERLAWDVGREVLGQVGFEDWTLFEEERTRGLQVYREILSLGPG